MLCPDRPFNLTFKKMSSKKESQKEPKTTIILSERDAELVFSLIENPPLPNEKLKAASAKHRQFFHETH